MSSWDACDYLGQNFYRKDKKRTSLSRSLFNIEKAIPPAIVQNTAFCVAVKALDTIQQATAKTKIFQGFFYRTKGLLKIEKTLFHSLLDVAGNLNRKTWLNRKRQIPRKEVITFNDSEKKSTRMNCSISIIPKLVGLFHKDSTNS